MILSRDATCICVTALPERHGGGTVGIYRNPDGRVFIKRVVARNRVVNVVDRYEQIVDGEIEVRPLDEVAGAILDDILHSEKSWAACFVRGEVRGEAIEWVRTEAEHRYTSTGVKFWRHRPQMESYRAGGGRTVVSTHISPEGACNLRCPYCSVTVRETHSRIALPRIQRYVSDLKTRGLRAVILTGGGEPTLYPQFDELVGWLKSEGLSVALITNGTTSARVRPETWRAFSWVRVSVNVFDGWRERIRIPREHLAPDCAVGCSFVSTTEHEAAGEEVPLDRVELFRQVAEVADKIGARYVRVLPNCLLEQPQLVAEHRALEAVFQEIGDPRFFHQYKVHRTPDADRCHQARFRPYLSEEPFVGPDGTGDGEPGSVYPCDSVVLNDSAAHFARKYQLCKPERVLDFLDGKIGEAFSPRADCTGCVFTDTVEMLGRWRDRGEGEFAGEPLEHEEFV